MVCTRFSVNRYDIVNTVEHKRSCFPFYTLQLSIVLMISPRLRNKCLQRKNYKLVQLQYAIQPTELPTFTTISKSHTREGNKLNSMLEGSRVSHACSDYFKIALMPKEGVIAQKPGSMDLHIILALIFSLFNGVFCITFFMIVS